MPRFKTKKIKDRKAKLNKTHAEAPKQTTTKNVLSTFYSFSVEKVDCGTTAQSELSILEPNWLLTDDCYKRTSTAPATTFGKKAKYNVR